jgi:hypothetical protein
VALERQTSSSILRGGQCVGQHVSMRALALQNQIKAQDILYQPQRLTRALNEMFYVLQSVLARSQVQCLGLRLALTENVGSAAVGLYRPYAKEIRATFEHMRSLASL